MVGETETIATATPTSHPTPSRRNCLMPQNGNTLCRNGNTTVVFLQHVYTILMGARRDIPGEEDR